jgi:iron complex outermembrane receptor protein
MKYRHTGFAGAVSVGLAVASILGTAQPVHAADDSGASLEEVVVTAQKRTERLQDIPVAAAVVGGNTIADLNASDISDLNRMVPSVNLNGTFNGRVPTGIRGISSVSSEGTVGISSGVAILIDGVPVPSDSIAGNQLEDIQSIEVLKGPQATLGGRTAASGVINIVTRKPTDTLGGEVSVTGTDDNELRLSGFLSGPITNGLKFSLSGYGSDRDMPIRNTLLGQNTSQHTEGLRGKLLFQPNDNLDITLTGRHARMTSRGFNLVYTYVSANTAIPAGTGFPINTPAQLLAGLTINNDNQQYASPVHVSSNYADDDVSLNIDWRLGSLTFGSTTAYQRENQDMIQDLFAVNSYWFNDFAAFIHAPLPPFFNYQHISQGVQQFSQEFKLASATDQKFSWLLGAFYSNTRVLAMQTRDLLPAYSNHVVEPVTKTTDVYGRGTWKFNEANSLIVGLRANYDQLSYNLDQQLYTFTFSPPDVVILPNQLAHDSSSETTVVGDLTFQHKYNDRSMVYATYARGYSPAVYNTSQSIDTVSPTLPPGAPPLTTSRPTLDLVKKETIDHLEVGSKTSIGTRLTVNVAIWDTIYKNFQIQNFDAASVGALAPPLILVPAGKAETRGVEADVRWAASNTLRLDGSVALVDAKFKDYDSAPCYYPDTTGGAVAGCTLKSGTTGTFIQNVSGKTMPNAPKLKFNLGAEQRVPLDRFDLVFAGQYSYTSETQFLADQNPHSIRGAFGILNLSAGLQGRGGKWGFTAFCNNVADKHYVVDMEDFWSSPWGATNMIVSQPARDAHRYFGGRLSLRF